MIAGLVRELVAINSANPATCADGAGEAELAAFCARWLRGSGVSAERVDLSAGPERPAVIARIVRGAPCRSLLMCGHLDTHTWYPPPRSPRSSTTVNGAGAADMKGGVAAIMAALAALAKRDEPINVTALLVPDEEHASAGMRAVGAHLASDGAVVLEDTALDLGLAQWGRVRAIVSARTAPQHAALLEVLAAQRRKPAGAPLRFGVASERSDLVAIERRVDPRESVRAVFERMQTELAPLVDDSVYWDVREPFLTGPSEPIVSALSTAAHRRGCAPRPRVLSAWTEAGIIAAAGVPTVVFGPGGGGAHSSDEWVAIDQVAAAAAVLTDTAIEFCRRGFADPVERRAEQTCTSA